MKKIIYTALAFFFFPVLLFSQTAKWQKTSTGRSVFTDKQLNNPKSAATKKNIKDNEDNAKQNLVSGSIYYVRDAEPWGVGSNNVTLLDQVFGTGNYTATTYSIDPSTLFSSSTSIIYLEGSYLTNPTSLKNFLATNITLAENWVSGGGHLFLNAAPNEGSNIDFGFGGTQLNFDEGYTSASKTGAAVSGQEGHIIFNGPFSPVGTSWSGNYFSHAYISGGSATPLITGTAGTILSELSYGAGLVLFGGLTTANFHSPQPEGNNLRANIYAYLLSGTVGCGAPSNLKVVGTKSDGVKLSWTIPVAAPKSFKIFYKAVSADTGTFERKAGTESSIKIGNLLPNTTYEWKMRSICDSGKSIMIKGPDFTTTDVIADNIKLFPNPVKTNMIIDGLPVTQKTKLTIVDLSGNARLVAFASAKTFNWNISALKPGNYLLKIETNNNTVSRWFVKE